MLWKKKKENGKMYCPQAPQMTGSSCVYTTVFPCGMDPIHFPSGEFLNFLWESAKATSSPLTLVLNT